MSWKTVFIMTTSPRKFSEKIALHQQKQAEGNAAFNQVMNELSHVPRNSNQQQLVPTPLRFHNSLPNVNQLGNQPLQGSHFLDDKNASGRAGDRVHRTQRKAHHMRHGTAPYNTPAFLSPPNDSSWRRTSSDSALHTSAMVGQAEHFPGTGSVPHKRDMVENMEMTDARRALTVWDVKKDEMVQNRPRSCEVPGIHICPSEQQQEPASSPIPISSNTGSLPDLTNLHIPPPLTTPLDTEDTLQYSNTSPGNMSPGLASPMVSNHILTNTAVPVHSPQLSPQLSPHMSPQPRRREVPQLILAANGQRIPCFPHSPQAINVQGITIDQQGNKFPIYQQQQQQQPHSPHHHQPSSPQHIQGGITLDMPKVGLQQYRDKTPTHTCSSPTSPVPNPEYSPVPSPGPIGSPGPVSPVQTTFNNSKAGNFYQQQAQNLPHQFEQISMLPESSGSPPSVSQQGAYGQSYIYTNSNNFDLLQQQPIRPPPAYPGPEFLSPHLPSSNIAVPDIVFTGPDFGGSPSSQDFARDLGNAIGDSGMDTILSETLILDPIDFDILSDNDPVADQAAEDSFRSDHL